MAKTITIFILFQLSGILYAQSTDPVVIYGTGGVYLGNYIGGTFDLDWIFRHNYTVSMGVVGAYKDASTTPTDYSPGLESFLSLGLSKPKDLIVSSQVKVGRILPINPSGTIRAHLSAGFGYGVIREPTNWQAIPEASLVENYTWEYHNDPVMSLVINPKLEFPFTRYFGYSLTGMALINGRRSFYGIGVEAMVGVLRSKKKPAN